MEQNNNESYSPNETILITHPYPNRFTITNSDQIKKAIFAEGIKGISNFIFHNSSIEYVEIPKSTIFIGKFAFSGCHLKKIKYRNLEINVEGQNEITLDFLKQKITEKQNNNENIFQN